MANYKMPVGGTGPVQLGTAATRLLDKMGVKGKAQPQVPAAKQQAQDMAFAKAFGMDKDRPSAKPKQTATQGGAGARQPNIDKINAALAKRSVVRVGKPAIKNGGQQLARSQYRSGKRKS